MPLPYLMRIAFFGGSFDPPHLGHVRIAQAAAERLHLDRVLFAPVALQPLKRDTVPAGFGDRAGMLRLLIADAGDARFSVTEIDAPRHDGLPNYTYDTLLRLKEQLAREARTGSGKGDQLFVLIGADSFLSVRAWHRAPELLMLADWIVAARPGVSLNGLHTILPRPVKAAGPVRQHATYEEQTLEDGEGRTATLFLMRDLEEDVSATAIRAALANHARTPLLSPSVSEYIRTHGLYR